MPISRDQIQAEIRRRVDAELTRRGVDLSKFDQPAEQYGPPKPVEDPSVARMGLEAAGEGLLNLSKRIYNIAGHWLPVPSGPLEEKHEAAERLEAARPGQTFGQNLAADVISGAPYAIPPYFWAEVATQAAERPERLLDLLKGAGQSYLNLARASGGLPWAPFAATPEQTAEAREAFRQRPLGELFNIALPVGLATGLGAKLGKAKKGVGYDRQAQGRVARGGPQRETLGRPVQVEGTSGEAVAPSREALEVAANEIPPTPVVSQKVPVGEQQKGLTAKQKRKLERAGVVPPEMKPQTKGMTLERQEQGQKGQGRQEAQAEIAQVAERQVEKEAPVGAAQAAPKEPIVPKLGTAVPEKGTFKGKPIWQIRRDEFVYSGDPNSPTTMERLKNKTKLLTQHRNAVRDAITAGENVSREVAKDYPEQLKRLKIKGATEKIVPTEERGAGFNFLKPFGTKEQQLARAIRSKKIEAELNKPAPTIELETKPRDAGTFIQHPSHKYGAIPDEFGHLQPRYGEMAARAQQKLMLTNLQIRADRGRGLREWGAITKQLSGREWKKYNDSVLEYWERPIGDVAKGNLPDKVKRVVVEAKKKSDLERKEIIEIERGNIRKSITDIAEKKYRDEHGLKGKRLSDKQRQEITSRADDLIKAEVPDEWGIQDYFAHLHLGDFAILRDGGYIGSAKSWKDALPKIAEDHIKNGGLDYKIQLREFHDPDVVRVTRGRQYKILNDLAKAFEEESPERIRTILSGKIGSREGKRKWAGFMQQRKGLPGYETDVRFVINYHNAGYHRWKNLYKLQSEIQPLLKKIRNERREFVARDIEDNLAELWGRPPRYKNEYQFRKWAGRVRGGLTATMLNPSLRYNLMNSLQLVQTGMVFSYKSLLWAQWTVRTKAGKALLDKYGIYDMIQGTGGELTRNYTSAQFRSSRFMRTLRLSPETSNQAEIWLAGYHHGKSLGMSDMEAADYGKLRGMVYSQFLPLETNRPKALRGGSVMSELARTTVGMYKNFVIHALELGTDLGKRTFGRNVPIDARMANAARLTHFVMAQLALGGARLITGPLGKLGIGGFLTYKLYNRVKDEYGEKVANLIAFGLPSLINSDWSASVQLIDLPYADNVPEAIGQMVLGPVGTIPLNIIKQGTVQTGYETNKWEQWTRATLEAFGGTKQILGLEKVLTGDYDFKSPSGKKKFDGDLKDALVQMYGSRPVRAAVESMKFDALAEIVAARNEAINLAVRGDWNKVYQFNALWPDAVSISHKEVLVRSKTRAKTKEKTAFERMGATKDVKEYIDRMAQ